VRILLPAYAFLIASEKTVILSGAQRSRRTCICFSVFRLLASGAVSNESFAMNESCYFTYIVASRSLTLYIGMTGNLRKRVFEHKRKLHDGFSATYNCNRLVWFERFVGPNAAIAREKQLKGWTRAKKIALIVNANSTWIDLSKTWYTAEELTWTPN